LRWKETMMETTEHQTVEAFLDRVREAWDAGDAGDAGDAEAYSHLFAEDASYVIFLGDAMFGRETIERTHHDVFTHWQQGTRMVVRPVDVRMVDADTAVAVTVGGIGKGDAIPFDKFRPTRCAAGTAEGVRRVPEHGNERPHSAELRGLTRPPRASCWNSRPPIRA
jgi:uncharacterized protein (TIGR02246 family)